MSTIFSWISLYVLYVICRSISHTPSTTVSRSIGGSAIHGRAHDRSRIPTRVRVPLIDLPSDTGRSVRDNVFVSVDDLATNSGPSSHVASTPLAF